MRSSGQLEAGTFSECNCSEETLNCWKKLEKICSVIPQGDLSGEIHSVKPINIYTSRTARRVL